MKPNYFALFISLLFLFLFIACKKDDTPVAEFSFDATSNLIQFNDKSINATNWHWDFGDTTNTFSTEQNPRYLYKYNNVSHIVTLTVSNSTGKTSTIKHNIPVKK